MLRHEQPVTGTAVFEAPCKTAQAAARGWYDSPAYPEVLPLRLEHTQGETILVEGVEADHRATDILSASLTIRAAPRPFLGRDGRRFSERAPAEAP